MDPEDALLINRPPMMNDETLDSIVFRSIKANYYDPIGIISHQVRKGYTQQAFDVITHPLVYERLNELLGISPQQLYKGSVHRFASIITPPGENTEFMSFTSGGTQAVLPRGYGSNHVGPSNDKQYCPSCLREAAYVRVHWLLNATTVCLVHQCLLVQGCPRCNKKLSTQDICSRHCSQCNYDLATSPTINVGEDYIGFQSQQFIQQCLMDNATPSLKKSPPNVSPRALFRLLDGLRSVVKHIRKVDSFDHSYSISKQENESIVGIEKQLAIYLDYATAFAAIDQWPISFHEFLNRLRQRSPSSQTSTKIRDHFGATLFSWLDRFWYGSEMQFVQDAFDEYLANQYPPSLSLVTSKRFQESRWFAANLPYITVPAAQELLNVDLRAIRRCTKNGRIGIYSTQICSNRTVLFLNRSDVMALRELHTTVISKEQVSQLIGVTRGVVNDLIDEGILNAIPGIEIAYNLESCILKEDLSSFIDKINGLVSYANFESKNCKTIHQVCQYTALPPEFESTRLSLVQVIKFIVDGRLKPYRSDPNDNKLSSMWFKKDDLQAFTDELNMERGWMSRSKVMKLLKVNERKLNNWVEAGFISPFIVIKTHYYKISDIENFKNTFVDTQIAGDILGAGRIAVQTWVRQGTITAVSGPGIDASHSYLFNRQYLEDWRASRVSFVEAKALLGIKRHKLERLIEHGELIPSTSVKYRHRFFLKEEVLQLRDKLGLPTHENADHRLEDNSDAIICPHCGAKRNQRKGSFTITGNRRYFCTSCNRSYVLFRDALG